jgi:hypothetical protein
VVAKTVVEAGLRGDEEAFAWATASLGEARRSKKRRASALLEAVVEELAFDLGARQFPPPGAREAGRGTSKRMAVDEHVLTDMES